MLTILLTRMAALLAGLRLPEFIVRGHRLEWPAQARNLEKKPQ